MEEYLNLIREKINSILDFINSLQHTIGLSNSRDDSIFGKINNLENQIQSINIPTYNVQRLVLDNNHFTLDFEPINGICLNDEITLYHPDGGTLVWEGISFNGVDGQLNGVDTEYDGWTIKVQYFYMSQI